MRERLTRALRWLALGVQAYQHKPMVNRLELIEALRHINFYDQFVPADYSRAMQETWNGPYRPLADPCAVADELLSFLRGNE
jgi:DNA-binding NarL/FixJ family response regulator